MAESGKRNYVWVAVVVSIVVVSAIGFYAFSVIESPLPPPHDPAQEDRAETQLPWEERGPRSFDYGSVPFVPAKSRYSHGRVEMPHLPNPEATRPPEDVRPTKSGGAQ